MAHKLLIKLYDGIKDQNLNMEKKFKIDDYDNSGLVEFYSFQKNIKKINEGISEADLLKLDDKYKVEVDGEEEPFYNYRQMLDDINNVSAYEEALQSLFQDMMKQMKLGKPNLFYEIELYDPMEKGVIQINELQNCFKAIGINMSNHNYAESIKFCFSDEKTGRIEYERLKKEFIKYLDNIRVSYDELCRNKADAEEVDEYWSKHIYLEFYKQFKKRSVLNPMQFFRDNYMAPGKDFITSYKFQKAVTDVFPDIEDEELNRFKMDITDKKTGKISLQKFCKVYDDMRKNFDQIDENELMEAGVDGDVLQSTRILHKIMKALERKNSSFLDFFNKYQFQTRLKTISKDSFFEACGDLEIEQDGVSFKDIEELFEKGRDGTYNLAKLDKFIEDYREDVPFYLNHKIFSRQKELLEALIHYSYELRRSEKVTKLIMQEDKDRTGLMDFDNFLVNMSYLDLGITNEDDQDLLLKKYDTTLDDETINVLEFCLDYETLLLNHYPDASNSLKERKPNMERLVEMIGDKILDKHETFEKWINTMRDRNLKWRIPINVFLLKLREEDRELTLKELQMIISELDRHKRGYIIDFRIKDYFSNYSSERANPAMVKLIEILKFKKTDLLEFTKLSQTKPGIVNFKMFARQLQSAEAEDDDGYSIKIEKHELKEMLDGLNLSSDTIELSELQLKIKHECKVHELLSMKEVEIYIMGSKENNENVAKVASTLVTILEPLVMSLRARKLDFREHFGKKKHMKKHTFKQRMKSLGVLNNPRYADLVDYIESEEEISDVDLTKLAELIDEQELKADQLYVKGKDPSELIAHIKKIFVDNRIKVGRIFHRYDSDNSERISAREFFILIQEIDDSIPKRDIKAMYKFIDRNGDKEISKLEFEKIFAVSLRDEMSNRVKKMAWASSHFAEISYVMNLQAKSLREYFKSGSKKGRISLSAFRIFIDDMDLQTLGTGRSKRKKLEESLKVDNDLQGDIDYYLLKACLEEFKDVNHELTAHEDKNTQLMSLICSRFEYNVDKICHVFDFDDDSEVTKYEFLTICNNIIPKNRKGEDNSS